MARVLICEPHREVLHLLERAVTRLGHEPMACDGEPGGAELLLLDTDDERSVACARSLREQRPELPIIALSIYPADPDGEPFAPVARLLKPFTRGELDRAIGAALGTLPGWPTASTPTAPSAT